jgi:hypothetical protein
MKDQAVYNLNFEGEIKNFIVHHDEEDTGIDIEREFERYKEIGELQLGSFYTTRNGFATFCGLNWGLVLTGNDK